MTENERNELIRFIESITFYAPKDGKPSWIKPAFDMIKEVIISKIDDIYNEKEMKEIDIHRKSYKELQQTVIDLSIENCLLKNKVEEMKWIPCSERTPEECVPVNVTWINRNPEPYYEKIKDVRFSDTAVYCNGRWFWWSSTCIDYLKEYGNNDIDLVDKDIDVVAWMPLPEPFEGEKK